MSSGANEKDYWNAVFSKEDPWGYTNAYEQQKYSHTLEMLPEIPISRVLEIGCAEGLFTEKISKK